jgi:parallel beta-helix repeat protein
MHSTKILTLLTILFLSSIFFIPGTTRATPQNTIHDQENTNDISSINTTIQDAINNAQPGTTLQLAAGIYREDITINKPLHLIGQGSNQTILHSTASNNGYAIRITTEGVSLNNLDISNQESGLYTTCIKISAPHTIIQNCSFHDTPIGIAIWSSHNTISGCDFRGCDDEGIALLGTSITPCTNNTITNSTFQDNCDGVELQYATDTLITSCIFIQNAHTGIDAIASNNNNNIISHCEFYHNQGFGLYLAGSSNTQIIQCSFSDDTITFVHTSNTSLSKSQITQIYLMEDSSLLLEQCNNITSSHIISQQSSYEIRTNQSEPFSQEKNTSRVVHQRLLLTLLSRFKILKSFYEHLQQLRL